MLPHWFWPLVIVAVLLLIIGTLASEKSAWLRRVFGRVLPDVSGWGAGLKALGASNWARIGALVVLIGGPLLWGAISYVEGRGADKVVARIERENAVNVERIGRAQTNFERDVRERMESAAVREFEISEEFVDVERSILEADSFDAIAAAHAAGVARLREHAASRHAAVVSDYASSLGDGPLPSPAGV